MDANRHPRVEALLAQLRHAGETQMRGLPLYNVALEIEAVGFGTCDDALFGIVITPWFINAIHLPFRKIPVDWSRIGDRIEHRLPGGPVTFTRGGDEATGQYDALSLHSPVSAFESQEMARHEADERLQRLLRPPPKQTETMEQPESPGRRAFLRGRAGGP